VTGRSTAAILLVLFLVVGGLAGVVIDRSILIPHHIGRRPARSGRSLWPAGQVSQDRFARDLDLTPSQRIRFDSIMSRQVRRFRATRERIQPAMDTIFAQTRAELDSILTPAQRGQLRALRDRNVFGFHGW
jgi:Spy/CpxP family protein refolding chaperone